MNNVLDLDISSVLKFDEDLSAVLRMELATNFEDISGSSFIEDGSVFGQLVKFWREIDGISNIMRRQPAILTGSAIEGCFLARLYDSRKADLEVEIDIMLVAGYVEASSAQVVADIVEDIQDADGYFHLKSHPCVKLLPPSYGDDVSTFTVVFNDRGYVNGDLLKRTVQGLQPKSGIGYQRIQVHGKRVVLRDINCGLEGPSAALGVKVKTCSYDDVSGVVLDLLAKLRQLRILLSNIVSLASDAQLGPPLQLLKESHSQWLLTGDSTVAISAQTCRIFNSVLRLLVLYRRVSAYIYRLLLDIAKMFCGDPNFLQNADEFSRHVSDAFDTTSEGFTSLKGVNWLGACAGEADIQMDVATFTRFRALCEKSENSRADLGVCWTVQDKIMKTSASCLEARLSEFQDTVDDKQTNVTFLISVDHVPCLYCPFWPSAAVEFLTRKRCWPSQDVISKICTQGCFCVAKLCGSGLSNCSWRWSFSVAEIMLVNLQSKKQRECYFWFKALFYGYLKFEVQGRSLPSYIVKTCMLHLCESVPARWWDERDVEQCILRLLEFLCSGLQQRKIQHYFMSKCNLLAGLPDGLMQLAVEKISELVNHEKCLRSCLSSSHFKVHFFISDFQSSSVACDVRVAREPRRRTHPLAETADRISSYLKLSLSALLLYVRFTDLHLKFQARLKLSSCGKYFYAMQQFQLSHDSAKEYLTGVATEVSANQLADLDAEEKDKKLSDMRQMIRIYDAFYPSNREIFAAELRKSTMFNDLRTFAVRELSRLMQISCTVCDSCRSSMTCGSSRCKCSCGLEVCNECEAGADVGVSASTAAESKHIHSFKSSTLCSCFLDHGTNEVEYFSALAASLPVIYEEFNEVMEKMMATSRLLGASNARFLDDSTRPLSLDQMIADVEGELVDLSQLITTKLVDAWNVSNFTTSNRLEGHCRHDVGIDVKQRHDANSSVLDCDSQADQMAMSEVACCETPLRQDMKHLQGHQKEEAMVSSERTCGTPVSAAELDMWSLPDVQPHANRMILTVHPSDFGNTVVDKGTIWRRQLLARFIADHGADNGLLQHRDFDELYEMLDGLAAFRVRFDSYNWLKVLYGMLKRCCEVDVQD